VVGWQGVRFTLPPEWNVTGFSLDRENGHIRVDSPGAGTVSVQVRWSNAADSRQGPQTPYYMLAPYFRKWLKRPNPTVAKTDLKQSLEKMLNDTAKDAKKGRAVFESQMKSEKVEGENGERTAISFSWTGSGRGQGKIWRCNVCNRVVIAQVIGMAKDHNIIGNVASQLFATFHDHSIEGFDLWGLYDLQASVPDDFRLESHKLMAGHLQLVFARGAERIILNRWGLANITLKKFTEEEWFRANAYCNTAGFTVTRESMGTGHDGAKLSAPLPLTARFLALRDAKGSLRQFPTRYAGGVWHCAQSNKLFSIQVLHNKKSEGLWESVVQRCLCH